jgi:hypothetical protein
MTEVEPDLRSSLEGDRPTNVGVTKGGGDCEAWERGEDSEHLGLALLQCDTPLQQHPHWWWFGGGVTVQGGGAQ